jgi:nitrite reductase (NADH) small subunit
MSAAPPPQETRPPASSWRAQPVWIPICALDDILPETGVCAFIGNRQIALVRVGQGASVFAVDNFDPFSKAFVVSRGIVGDQDGVPKISSPIFKQSFNLITGQCLDDPLVALPTYPVRVQNGHVELLAELPEAGASPADERTA